MIATAILLLSLLTPAAPTHEVIWDAALLHEEPSTESQVTGELEPGTRVRVEEIQGAWAKVGERGWVLLGFLRALEPPGGGEPGPEPAAEPGPLREEAPATTRPEQERESPALDCEPLLRAARAACDLHLQEEAERAGRWRRQLAGAEEAAGACRGRLAEVSGDLEEARGSLEECERRLDATPVADPAQLVSARRELEAARETIADLRERLAARPEESDLEALRTALDRATARAGSCREDLEDERKLAREAGREEGRREARSEAEEELAALRERHQADLSELRETMEEKRAAAVEAARREERERVAAFLEELERLREAQMGRDRKQAEKEVETLHEAELRKLRLDLEQDCIEALDDQRRKMERDHAAELLRATESAERAFRDRLDLLLEEERTRHRRSLEALRASLDLPADPSAQAPAGGEVPVTDCGDELREARADCARQRERAVDEAVREALARAEGGDACHRRLEAQRREMLEERERVVQREVREAEHRERRDRPPEDRNARPEVRASGGGDVVEAVACEQRIRAALDRARAEWQAETARYVEQAVERARRDCGPEG